MGRARELAELYYEHFGAGDFERATALFAEECLTVTPSGIFSLAEHEASGRVFKSALPDAHMELVRAVEGDDEVYITGRFRGTHQGDLVSPQGTIPASGNTLDMPFADYFRVSGGRIIEHEVIWDQMTLLAQLGAFPQGSPRADWERRSSPLRGALAADAQHRVVETPVIGGLAVDHSH